MNKFAQYLIIIVIMAGFLISCSINYNVSKKTDPFEERSFEPYLNDEWIGSAISYGCYRKGQAPGSKGPSAEEILEDLNIIKQHWNLIRVYNADDDTDRILQVIQKHDLPIKVMLGVWLVNETDNLEMKHNNETNVLRSIEMANSYPEIVAAINAGNETQVFWSWHKMDRADLIRYIRQVRSNTSVPVTTADDYNFWNKPESKDVADEVDFIVTHIYPLWNGKTLENAISWLDETYQEVKRVHPQKQIVLGEIGWATMYNAEKKGPDDQGTLIKGDVSLEAQGKFLMELDKWVMSKKATTFLFEAFDEPWKGGGDATGPREIEKNWGVYYEDRTAKESFEYFIKHNLNLKTNSLRRK